MPILSLMILSRDQNCAFQLGDPTRYPRPHPEHASSPTPTSQLSLSSLRLKPLSHSQPFLSPAALSPPSSSFISNPRAVLYLLSLLPSLLHQSSNRHHRRTLVSTLRDLLSVLPRVLSRSVWQLRKNKSSGGLRKTGSRLERGYCSDMETMSPRTVSSRRSVSHQRWDSPKSSSFSFALILATTR
ncbi:hypothetical protein HID58_096178 [Brassica napus]|uniref:Uncharacterized protein n=1 Tax=Brassica napus TaxID=3708 RepID=A0ABQ7X176_BRANA|nr:hypothetical protein HID58_096178 [Brassica napus]